MSDDSLSQAPRPRPSAALVDAHVHLHSRFDVVRFFRCALANVTAAARALGVGEPWCGVLVLTDAAGSAGFTRLRASVDRPPTGSMRVTDTGESLSVLVRTAPEARDLVVIGGRQIQTAEGLEVLGFPLADSVPDGQPIDSVVDALADQGAARVIPWGLGKWWLRRGRTVARLLERTEGTGLMLADTGHRPAWAPTPRLLTQVERGGGVVLTGSDPLPLAGEETRGGSCAFELRLPPTDGGPAELVSRALFALRASPRRFEQRCGAARFAATQLAMQLRKRGRP